jgi:hypothetical protein
MSAVKKVSTIFIIWMLLISASLFLLSPSTSRPFTGHHEFNGVFYSQIARNYLRHGLIQTRLTQNTSPQTVPPSSWGTHTHHPPTYPLILAGMFAVFGESETTARLLSLGATISGLVLITLAIYALYPYPYLPLILLPLISTPLLRYYASLPVFEPLLLLATGGLIYSLVKRKPRLLLMFAFALIIIDWPGYWPVVTLLLISAFVKDYRFAIKPLLSALMIATIAIIVMQWLATGHPYRDLLRVGSYRVTAAPYSQYEWWLVLFHRAKAFIGLPLIVLIIPTFMWLKKMKNQNTKIVLLTLYSLIFGVAHILVFRNIAWYHDYMLFHLIPFFILISGAVFIFLSTFHSKLILFAFFVAASLSTWLTTKPFYEALVDMVPHQDCVAIAKAVKAGEKTITVVSEEKSRECPPFIHFYADQTVPLTVE